MLGQKLPNAVGRGLIYVPASSLLKAATIGLCSTWRHPANIVRPAIVNQTLIRFIANLLLERHAIARYLTLAEELVGVCLPCRIRLNLCALESCFALHIGHHQLSQLHQLF